jgi:hypothetical protein
MNPQELDTIYEGFHDDETFARESLTVQNKLGKLVPMIYGPAQLKAAALIKKLERERKRKRVIALKARQVWFSNYVASRFWRDTVHTAGQRTLVLAHDHKAAAKVFEYYLRFQDTYKPFAGVIGLPKLVSDRNDLLEYANGSRIDIHSAGNVNIGRGGPLRRVHFSEFAFYPDHARQLMAAVMSALADDLDTEAIIESTANGIGNEFHIMWQLAVAGESEWVPFFFAWWEHPEYRAALDNCAAFQRSLSETEREMMGRYNLSLEQLAWRRRKIATDLNGDEELFAQEYPSNPEEAFLSSGRPRFSHKAIARMPVIRDAIEGALEMIELSGQKKLVFTPREKGELTLYRKPQEHREYIIPADAAEGIDVNEGGGKSDPDYAVAHVYDRDTGEQVAHLRARFTPAEFGWQLYLLGIYYYWAGIVPEANGPGLAAIDALLRHGYPPSAIYHRIRTPDQDPAERADLIGFKTTVVTRPQMISLLDEALRTQAVLVHHPNTVSELMTFAIKANGRAEHRYGCHDDEVITLGLGCVGIQEMPRRKKQNLRAEARPAINNYRTRHDKTDERGERLRLL